MKLLNKLNGWQRIWLIPTVAVQIFLILNSRWLYWPSYESCLKYESVAGTDIYASKECTEYLPQQGVFMDDIEDNLKALFLCLAVYAVAHLAVIIVRWVISGFKK